MDTLARRKEVGIIGLVVVLVQSYTTLSARNNLSDEFQELRIDFNRTKIAQSQTVKTNVDRLNSKIDELNTKLTVMNKDVRSLRAFLRSNLGYEALQESYFNEDELYGITKPQDKTPIHAHLPRGT